MSRDGPVALIDSWSARFGVGRSFEPGRSVAHAHADVLAQLVDDRLLELPPRLPPHVADISALASWMAYSNLLNRIDLQQMETHHGSALG